MYAVLKFNTFLKVIFVRKKVFIFAISIENAMQKI